MPLSVEAVIALIALFAALPQTLVLLWYLYRRSMRRYPTTHELTQSWPGDRPESPPFARYPPRLFGDLEHDARPPLRDIYNATLSREYIRIQHTHSGQWTA
ncbi:hypothetical protein B0I35DRAFT_439670 [Stachybotrys elegans]|uniref:Uncharacterized protein n=1 Tax=Stachybotrys elegans TaxID=80388 RepID=A0A8K0SNQ7_9HYPO|nr:hypothetical protein B0I35DRAFT_439670 [Stachybotrys elegans]